MNVVGIDGAESFDRYRLSALNCLVPPIATCVAERKQLGHVAAIVSRAAKSRRKVDEPTDPPGETDASQRPSPPGAIG